VNGVDLPLAELVDVVTTIAGAHGIGRHERTTSGGPTARELHESPAAAVLRQAHRDLEGATLSADQVAFRPIVAAQYAALVDDGRWYSPLRVALDAYTDAVQSAVNGTVRLRLFKGDCRVIGRRTVLHDRSPIAAGAGR
jgi:argininosuccinate synthase